MPPRSAPWAQASLAACAFTAAMAYGAPWLGLGFTYDVSVNGHQFQLGADFPLGMLAALAMGVAAGLARGQGRSPMAASALSFGGGAIFASSLYLLLIWAPGGAPAGQLELLKDAGRLGFALMALAVPLALPPATPSLARLGTLAVGALLAPVLLFPHHVEAAGLTDVHTTLPMLLFFVQGLLALTGTAHLTAGKGWGSGRRASTQEDGVTFLRARVPGAKGKPKQGKAPRLAMEALRGDLAERRPEGPSGPEGPQPRQARKRPAWFYQF